MNLKNPIKNFLNILRILISSLAVTFVLTGYAVDTDDDGTNDTSDAFPLNSTEWLDTDSDGVGNNADLDDDNDGVLDDDDEFPLDFLASNDSDLDGYPDYAELEIVSNGQVLPEWDYGINGIVADYYVESRHDQEERSAYVESAYISHCETGQTSNFDLFHQAYISQYKELGIIQAHISLARPMDHPWTSFSNVEGFYNDEYTYLGDFYNNEHRCQSQNISIYQDPSNEENSYFEVEFSGLPLPNGLYYDGAYASYGLNLLNGIAISRSEPINLSESKNLYLEVVIKTEPPVNAPIGNLSPALLMLTLADNILEPSEGRLSFHFKHTDNRCYGNGTRNHDRPFDPSVCGYEVHKFPLSNQFYNFTESFSGIVEERLKSIRHILISSTFDALQLQCNWFLLCDKYKLSHRIKSIKIISGDEFDNDPNEYMDPDLDGIGSNSDSDNDNDGISNELDAFPFDPSGSTDMDGDGIADYYDMDINGDGAPGNTYGTAFKFGNGNPEMGWVFEISENSFFIESARNGGCEIYEISCIEVQFPGLDNENFLIIPTVAGGEMIWGGGNEFSSNDFDDDNDGYLLENDRFPRNTYEWADIDNDCVPDNIDNDLSSIADTDCDGLSNDLDTDDDNDTIPDNLIVNLVEDGDISDSWIASSLNTFDSYSNDCNYVLVISDQTPEFCDFKNKNLSLSLNAGESFDIYSEDFDGYGLPVGFLEFEIQALNISDQDTLEVRLETSMQEVSLPLEVSINNFHSNSEHDDWFSVKFPLYDFYEDNTNRDIDAFFSGGSGLDQTRYLSRVKHLHTQLDYHNPNFSISIKNIRFVVSDLYPNEKLMSWSNRYSSNDFDHDGRIAWNDSTPFSSGDDFGNGNIGEALPITNWDLDGNGVADALTDGLLLLRHTFELTGASLTDAAISSNSPLSPAEVELKVESVYEIADIDSNGSVDALTDGLLLMRYLFGLRDNSLINNVVSPEAARFAAAEVEDYIERFMPEIDSSRSDSSGEGI